MKKTFTILSVLMVLGSKAQTITYSNFLTSVSSVDTVVIANNSSFNMALTTTTGTVIWNATSLTAQSGVPTVHLIFGNVAATPNGNLYPSSSYVLYDPALTALVSYNYFQLNADSLTDEGSFDPSASHEIFQNPDKRLVFPFSYNQSFTDSYEKTNYSDLTTISSVQTGTRTVSFNGFGTLILPQGTYNNVALISEMRTNNLGPNSPTFTWYNINNGKKLLMYHENAGSTTVGYCSETVTGIDELSKGGLFTIAPNPFSSQATISFSDMGVHQFKIMDVLGREICNVSFVGKQYVIEKGGMNKGVYFVQTMDENKNIFTKKIIIQ